MYVVNFPLLKMCQVVIVNVIGSLVPKLVFEKINENCIMFMMLLLDIINGENKYNAILFQQVRSKTKYNT